MEQTAIFCDTDNFCKAYVDYYRNRLLMDKEEVVPGTKMSLSEIMTILIMYHLSGYKTFKWYYTKHVMIHQRKDYSDIISYNRFVEIMKFALVPLILYTLKARSGKCSGISFIDSTHLKVCDNHRIHNHRIFSEYAKKSKNSMGWFDDFRLHPIISDKCG